ncbi:MAG: hypothetical protein LUD69_05880 [Oscillospiraceae bacterium]|nr:hypothetical protein [Oscillospiraceae bacterium]
MADPRGIPKTEILWETIRLDDATYYVTSKKERTLYYIYKQSGNGLEKLGKAKTPVELEQFYRPKPKKKGDKNVK